MFLEFEDYRPDTPRISSGRSRCARASCFSIIGHLLIALMFAYAPRIPFLAQLLQPSPRGRRGPPGQLERMREQQQAPRFVFVQPKVEMPAPERAEASDRDRVARSIERAPNPDNPLPFSRGNSTDRIDADREPAEKPRGQGPAPEP